jgi:hypothetical protein
MTMMLILGGFHRWILMWRWNTTWSTNRGSIGRQAADQQGTCSRPCHFALDPWIAHELVLPLSCMKVVCWGSIYSWCSNEQIIFSSAVWSIPCYPCLASLNQYNWTIIFNTLWLIWPFVCSYQFNWERVSFSVSSAYRIKVDIRNDASDSDS